MALEIRNEITTGPCRNMNFLELKKKGFFSLSEMIGEIKTNEIYHKAVYEGGKHVNLEMLSLELEGSSFDDLPGYQKERCLKVAFVQHLLYTIMREIFTENEAKQIKIV